MSVTVFIPTPLQKLTHNQAQLSFEGSTFAEFLESFEQDCPSMRTYLYNEQGELSRFIKFYVNNEDILCLSGKETPLKDGDEVSIICAMSGG